MDKGICRECGSRIELKDVLKAKNPFDEKEAIIGCPVCKSVDSIDTSCQVEGCWNLTTCGTPTKNGYMHVCGKHFIELSNENK